MAMKLRTITNGVDLERFCPAASRTVAEVPPEGVLELLAVGNIVENKNVCGLIKALMALRRTNRLNVRVRWAGKRSKTLAGQQLFARAERMLTENALAGSWEWLGERTDIPELLRSHDALIHPSFYEGMSNAICEALACGRPVLASDVCDHRNLVQDGRTGFLFDPTSPEDMAAAIHRFGCLSPSARERAGLLARQFAEAALGQDDFADAYEGLFNELYACNSR
jgi:glycosyltransferase involved in cell wall biosynthesis